jgi:hexosaminidase
MKFDARIDGDKVVATLTADRDLAAPVFCFSMMAPVQVVAGGTLQAVTASYAEVALPDLDAGAPHAVTLAHPGGLRPANRAWLPLGAYLRTADGPIPLPPLPAGVRPRSLPSGPRPDLALVPPVQAFRPAGGSAAAPAFVCSDAAFVPVEALAARTGLGPFLGQSGLPLRLEVDSQIAPEGYHLDIAPDGVTLAAPDSAGTRHGAITLLTLKATHQGALPCGRIEDAPRFAWRGFHLDCARHYHAPATIARLMDLMALMKLNRFHWHFADDEAFRLEVSSLPELWQRSAIRGDGALIPGVCGGGISSGGSYPLEEVARLVAHGRELGIEILPEIEVPAHSYAFAKVYPDCRDPADNGTETSVHGYPENVLNPALPATWNRLEALAAEIAGLFPLGIVHLGCDEVPDGAWSGSPEVAALMQREGLDSRDDVQGWTMARLAATLPARPAAWEEATRGANGGIGHDALIFSWTGQQPGIDAARAGHDVVMCPAQHTYFDLAHTADPDDWGAAWTTFIDLADTIAWDPIPAPDITERIVGVQGCFWGEFTTEDAQIEPMIAPRILGLAVQAWAPGSLDAPQLYGLAAAYGSVFDTMGWETALR